MVFGNPLEEGVFCGRESAWQSEPAVALAAAGVLALNGSEFWPRPGLGIAVERCFCHDSAQGSLELVWSGRSWDWGPIFVGPTLQSEYHAFPSGPYLVGPLPQQQWWRSIIRGPPGLGLIWLQGLWAFADHGRKALA